MLVYFNGKNWDWIYFSRIYLGSYFQNLSFTISKLNGQNKCKWEDCMLKVSAWDITQMYWMIWKTESIVSIHICGMWVQSERNEIVIGFGRNRTSNKSNKSVILLYVHTLNSINIKWNHSHHVRNKNCRVPIWSLPIHHMWWYHLIFFPCKCVIFLLV